MKDLNKIILIGRLGTDPVQRETKNGTPVTHFSLATSRRVATEGTDGTEKTEETVWHNVVVWGRQAETCNQYLKKGNTVYVEGSIRKRSYKTQQGEPRISFEVHAENVGFLGGGNKRSNKESESAVTEESAASLYA